MRSRLLPSESRMRMLSMKTLPQEFIVFSSSIKMYMPTDETVTLLRSQLSSNIVSVLAALSPLFALQMSVSEGVRTYKPDGELAPPAR